MWVLAYVIVLQLVVGTVGLFVVDPEAEGDSVATDGTAATSTTAAGATTGTTAKPKGSTGETTTTTTSAPSAAASSSSTTATTARSTTNPTLTPTKAGEYEYKVRITDEDGTSDSTGSYSYEAARQSDGELRQTMRDVEEDTTTTVSFAWRGDGLYLRTVNEEGTGCNIEPDLLLVPSPLRVGHQWALDSSCTVEGETTRFQATAKVLRTERVTVAGRSVDTYVLETRTDAFHTIQHYSVAHGLVVREETVYDDDDDDSTEVVELLNLDPK